MVETIVETQNQEKFVNQNNTEEIKKKLDIKAVKAKKSAEANKKKKSISVKDLIRNPIRSHDTMLSTIRADLRDEILESFGCKVDDDDWQSVLFMTQERKGNQIIITFNNDFNEAAKALIKKK